MRLIDSHCHLQAERFDGDRDEVIARAAAAGVERVLVPGWDLESSAAAVALAARYEWLDAAVGIHPHDAARADAAAWQGIVQLAPDSRVVAIGETGLDYDRMFSPLPAQHDNLRRHLRLALETGKPAILHVRSRPARADAQDRMLEELRLAGVGGSAWASAFAGRPRAVLHSFSGSVEFARAALDLGLAVSFSGLAFRRGEESAGDVVPLVPRDRLLVETDSPFLSPPGAPKRRNEPEWVRITADWLTERRGGTPDQTGDGLVAAYAHVFGS